MSLLECMEPEPQKLFNCTQDLETFWCDNCDFKTTLLIFLEKHLQEHEKESQIGYALKSFSCGKCSFKTNSSLHWIKHSSERCSPETPETTKFECDGKAPTRMETPESVQSLIADPFSTRSSNDKIEIKRVGRPTPTLIIKQFISSKNRTFNRTFNSGIYKKHTWICGCDVRNALFCFPCLLFGGEESWTKTGMTDLNHLGDRIKTHTLSVRHMKNVLQFSLFGTQLDTAYRRNIQLHNEKVRHNRYILNIIINCVRFCGAFELVLKSRDESASNPGLINISAELDVALKEHLKKATVFKRTSKTIQDEILQTMFSVCQEEISKEIKEADYLSVIVEETSGVSNIYQMAIVFRYIARGKLVERFWDFLTPSDHSEKTLSLAILQELDKHVKDDKIKVIAQTYDGAAVTSGAQAIVKQTYAQAAYVHCYAHQLNSVMLNAASANKNVRMFFANLQGLSTFFSSDPHRIAILDEIVKKRLPRSSPTRWNFNSRIVCTVFEYRKDIIEAMRTILRNKTTSATSISEASGYITILTSKSFISWLNLFYQITPRVDLLFAKFQTRQIDPVLANKHILSFETQLAQIRDGIAETSDTNEPKRPKTDTDGSAREAKEVCDIVIREAKDRFSFTGHIIAATLLFSEKYSLYSIYFPEKNFQETIKVYPFLNGQKFRTELTVIYETEEFRTISGLLPFYELIRRNVELNETFSETLKLLKILITIPMASSETGRCFSTLEKIKTFLRNTWSLERLSTLAMLSLERDLIESIPDFNQRVIEKFANTKDRRKDFILR